MLTTAICPNKRAALNGTLARLQVELQGNQDAISRAQQNKTVLQGTIDMAEAAAGTSHSRRASANPFEVSTNSNQVPEGDSKFLQSQYDALSKLYQPTYPRMVALKHEIDKQKLVEDSERARIENLKTQMTLADREIQQRNSERERILNSIERYQARIEQLPVREQETAALTRDYEMSKSNYKSLLDKKLAAGMATSMEKRQQGQRFTMLDPPRVPEKPISPKRPQFIGIGCALSLALALAFPIAMETKKKHHTGRMGAAGRSGRAGKGALHQAHRQFVLSAQQEEMGRHLDGRVAWNVPGRCLFLLGASVTCTNPSSA